MMHNPRVLELAGERDAIRELQYIGADEGGIGILKSKALWRAVKAHNVDTRAANILKQEMLARGGDVAVARDVVTLKDKLTDVILLGTEKQFVSLISKLITQPFGLKTLSAEIKRALDAYDRVPADIVWGRFKLELSKKTCVMGILNVTPDSFSDGGRFADFDSAVAQALKMREDGADIIDIGGESTRPGADPVPGEEEKRRVVPVIETLVKELDIPVSIDTYKADIAQAALNAGAAMINDISAMSFDSKMPALAAASGVPVVLMHIKGTPKDMQLKPEYKSLMGEITGYLRDQAKVAEDAGVASDNIIVDPGLGFGKTVAHNLEIIRRAPELKSLGYPVMIGPSRKSFIGKVLDTEIDDRLEGTAAAVSCAVAGGASLVRVHDVKEMARVVKVTDAVVRA